jgi:hypothetical protein
VLVGFTTYTGTVTAASDWDAPAELKRVRPALAGSVEDLFHGVGYPRFLLDLRAGGAAAEALRAPRLERAIGVIYRPQTERRSHYFPARLSDQFDAVLHFDRPAPSSPWTASPASRRTRSPRRSPPGSDTDPVASHGFGRVLETHHLSARSADGAFHAPYKTEPMQTIRHETGPF